jgi:cation transport regulator ChaC
VALVFQYGSNTDTDRLNGKDRLDGKAVPKGAAETVEHYEIAFSVWSKTNKCAAADLVRKGNRSAWGVLFEVPDTLLARATSGRVRSFDAIEAEGQNYRRYWLPVRDSSGSVVVALTYVVIKPRKRIRTSANYVGHIIKGLRDHGVPGDYVDWVKKLAVRNNKKLKGKLT